MLFVSAAAYAANGDIAGTIYTTDILTQVDGKDITSYSLDGETLIALEDLEQYGFNVKYDDSIRTVFINQTEECPADFNPSIPRGEVGGTAGYYYESDIQAYVNGDLIMAYSLDGKMAAKVEDLGRTAGTENNSRYGVKLGLYGVSEYLMSYEYDDLKRLLSLYTGKSRLPSPEEIKSCFENWDDYFWFYDSEVKIDGGSVLIGGQSGTSHGTYLHIAYVGDDSLYMSLDGFFRAYKFNSVWGNLRADNFEADGECIVFDGTKSDGREGKYRLNPRTFELEVIEESEPDESKASEWNFPESPEGKSVITSDVNVVIDGIRVQAYMGLDTGIKKGTNRTFIDSAVLTHFGFSRSEANGTVIYNKISETDKSWADTIRPQGEEIGTIAFTDMPVNINGHYVTTYDVGGKKMIDADELWGLNYGKGTREWELYNRYKISSALISGSYNEETNTLSLDTSGYTDVYFDTLKETIKQINNGWDTEIHSAVLSDTADRFIMKYTVPSLNSAECYLAVSNGEYGKAYELNCFFNVYGIWEITDFELDGDYITAVQSDGTKHKMDIKTFELIRE